MSLKFKVPPKVLQEKLRRCIIVSNTGVIAVANEQTISITCVSEFGNETISVKVNTVIESKGKFALDISKLLSLCGTMSELIDISETEKKIIIRHKDSVFRLDRIDPDTIKFINLPDYEETLKKNIKIDINKFLEIISCTIIPKSFLPKKSMIKEFYTITQLNIENLNINFLSAVESIFCLNTLNVKENNYDKLNSKAVYAHTLNTELLEKIARVFSGNIFISDIDCLLLHDDYFGVITKDICYFCTKASSVFPDVKSALERFKEGFTFSINRESFKNALLRASKVSVNSPVVFETLNDTLEIKTFDSSEKIILEEYENLEELKTGFRSELLYTIVNSYSEEIIELRMNLNTSPLVISEKSSNCVFYVGCVTEESYEDIN